MNLCWYVILNRSIIRHVLVVLRSFVYSISLESALSPVDQFAKCSILKPNYDKTCCIKIGSLKNENLIFQENYKIQWSHEPFLFLSITCTDDLSNIIELNYRDMNFSIRKMIFRWSKRNLSTLGRITVVKSLILPKRTYLFLSLPNPNKELIKKIDTLFFNYIWNSKTDRKARKHFVKQYHNGGLEMFHTKNFLKSLKIPWLRRLEQSNSASVTFNLLKILCPIGFVPLVTISLTKYCILSTYFWYIF